MAEAWGPWIEHDQKHVPNEVLGRYVQIESEWPEGGTRVDEGVIPASLTDNPDACLCFLGGGRLANGFYAQPIIRYRIRRPDALRNLIDLAEQVEDLTPETVKALVGV